MSFLMWKIIPTSGYLFDFIQELLKPQDTQRKLSFQAYFVHLNSTSSNALHVYHSVREEFTLKSILL